MTDRNFLASFKTMDQAAKAERALHESGFHEVQVDYISPYRGEGVEQLMNPLTGNIPNLANLTLDADITNKSSGILTGVDVSASGMSDGYNMKDGNEEDTGRNVLLTVVTNEQRAQEAESIIKNHGGII